MQEQELFVSSRSKNSDTSLEIGDPDFLQENDISTFGAHLPVAWLFSHTLPHQSELLTFINFSLYRW